MSTRITPKDGKMRIFGLNGSLNTIYKHCWTSNPIVRQLLCKTFKCKGSGDHSWVYAIDKLAGWTCCSRINLIPAAYENVFRSNVGSCYNCRHLGRRQSSKTMPLMLMSNKTLAEHLYWKYFKFESIHRAISWRPVWIEQILLILWLNWKWNAWSKRSKMVCMLCISRHSSFHSWKKQPSNVLEAEVEVLSTPCHIGVCITHPIRNVLDFSQEYSSWKIYYDIKSVLDTKKVRKGQNITK